MIPDGPRSICVPGNDPLIGHGWTAASSSPFILESNLGIKDWLRGAMQVNRVLPSVGGGAGDGSTAPDTVSYEVKFVIVSNGSVTPTWTLVRLSANTGTGSLPFFSTGRTRTHDLIITIGPSSTQTNNAHLALQIGNAVSNANRAGLRHPKRPRPPLFPPKWRQFDKTTFRPGWQVGGRGPPFPLGDGLRIDASALYAAFASTPDSLGCEPRLARWPLSKPA
jgi:hypothetical protein